MSAHSEREPAPQITCLICDAPPGEYCTVMFGVPISHPFIHVSRRPQPQPVTAHEVPC